MRLLDTIVAEKRRRFAASDKRAFGSFLEPGSGTTCSGAGNFRDALLQPGIRIIAEIKPRSPVSGPLLDPVLLDELLSAYHNHCAAASVLTDDEFFGGSFELLDYVVQRTGLPVLCKDFIIDRRQIVMARNAGASAVLIIASILKETEMKSLISECRVNGLEPVFEINNKSELELAKTLDVDVILINNRNLSTMTVDLATTPRLAREIGAEQQIISASGIDNAIQLKELLPFTKCFLIGTALMQCKDPEKLLQSLTSADLEVPIYA